MERWTPELLKDLEDYLLEAQEARTGTELFWRADPLVYERFLKVAEYDFKELFKTYPKALKKRPKLDLFGTNSEWKGARACRILLMPLSRLPLRINQHEGFEKDIIMWRFKKGL